jgi:hypothetical protein
LNYKETLYFIAKCLTISLEEKNRQEIEDQLKSTSVDWDAVVKVSTAHYVYPALYCNLKRTHLLKYLPQKLKNHMVYITDLNRKRNQQILVQAKSLNELLLSNNITPIFLKGTGNLLVGIYEDIAERMIGDIDFIVSKEDYLKVIKLLRNFGYSEVASYEYFFPDEKHYRRLQKENSIAAVEIHLEFLEIKKYKKEFNFSFVKKNTQVINGVTILSYADKLNLSIIANQINDNGFYFKSIALRNAYDVFLLSKKTSAKASVNMSVKLSYPLNCFLAACYEVFNKVNSLEYNNTKKTTSYLKLFNSQFYYIVKTKRRHKLIKSYLIFKSKLNLIYKSIIYRKYRVWLLKKVFDKNWYKEKTLFKIKIIK